MPSNPAQEKRIASFVTPAGKDEFSLIRFDADEALSELFTYNIEATSKTENADLQSIMSEKCSIKFTLKNKSERVLNGTLIDAQWLGQQDDLYIYRFTLRPWLWLLSQRSDCRIFKNKTALDIIKEIFKKESSASFDDRTSETLQPIDYCVQYRETDLDFVLRLMEQYGIYYYFKHSDGDHKLVLCDSRSGHDLVTPSAEPTFEGDSSIFAFVPGGNRFPRAEVEHLTQWSTIRRLRTGKVELKDYDFEKSESDLTARAEEGFAKAKSYEAYDYPATYTKRDQGEHFARVRAQAEQAKDDRRYAGGEAPSLYPGALMKLGDHPASAENTEYLVVRATHSLGNQSYRSGHQDDAFYSGSFEMQKSDRRFRAPLHTPRPKVYGPHTAKVVGEKIGRSFATRSGIDVYALRIGGVIEPQDYATRFPAFLADPMMRRRDAWTYIDARDLGQIVHLCLEKDGLGFQVFNAVNDEIIANIPTAEFLAKVSPETPIRRKLEAFEGPMSNRKAREVLGFREEHNWRKYVTTGR